MVKTSTFRVAATLAGICLCGPAWALGSTPVTVVNPADIAKAEGIQHPFQGNIICSDTSTNGAATFCDGATTTPPGKRLVIEYVAAECGLDAGEALRRVFVHTETQALFEGGGVGSSGDHSLNVLDHFGVAQFVAMGQPVRFYADPNTQIKVSAQETGAHNDFFCTFDFVGQAIDVP